MSQKQRFDDWPERYDRWFESPVGKAVLNVETELILEMLRPAPGERILDAGSGTGIFTREFVARGAKVIGLDVSLAMLLQAAPKAPLWQARGDSPLQRGPKAEEAAGEKAPVGDRQGAPDTASPAGRRVTEGGDRVLPAPGLEATENVPLYHGVAADMLALPFPDNRFDKSVTITALEFIADEKRALTELFRVTRSGGAVVAATLNSLSPWAERRSAKARHDPESIFNGVFFRSPGQLLAAVAFPGVARTAVHFGKGDDPATFGRTEREGEGKETGAFVAVRWVKP